MPLGVDRCGYLTPLPCSEGSVWPFNGSVTTGVQMSQRNFVPNPHSRIQKLPHHPPHLPCHWVSEH